MTSTRVRIVVLLPLLWLLACTTSEPRATTAEMPAPVTLLAQGAGAPLPSPFSGDENSLKFAVLGDFGTGDRMQYALANRMAAVHDQFPFELVVLVGDNIYGSERPQDFVKKFETPYKPLLDRGVKFYASLGNHDAREQRFYKFFNMDGELFYSFQAPRQSVRFFALESTYMEPEQVEWLDKALGSAGEDWKIVFQHHPLYSSGRTHGSDERLRATLEPLLRKHGVSLVLTGHDHDYERIVLNGFPYFVNGLGGYTRYSFQATPVTGSEVRYNNDFGAMLVVADQVSITYQFIAVDGIVVDTYLQSGGCP